MVAPATEISNKISINVVLAELSRRSDGVSRAGRPAPLGDRGDCDCRSVLSRLVWIYSFRLTKRYRISEPRNWVGWRKRAPPVIADRLIYWYHYFSAAPREIRHATLRALGEMCKHYWPSSLECPWAWGVAIAMDMFSDSQNDSLQLLKVRRRVRCWEFR